MEDGWIGAKAKFFDLGRQDLAFREVGKAPEVTLADVRFSVGDQELSATLDHQTWTLGEVPDEGTITVEWRFKPGGDGRHGKQGWAEADWASFDGRSLLLPRGRHSLRTVRFRYLTPPGWTVVHPWKEEDGWLVARHPRALKPILTATCVAAGRFDIRRRKIGDTEVRVGSPTAWDEAWRDRLATQSFALFDWFHESLGYDRRAPFAIAWLPKAHGESQVFGGASVNGACYEHPEDNGRAWLLLGHRIAHPMNKYVPAGLTLRDQRDHWFMEGWASYIEVVGADQAGLLQDQRYWNKIYRRYLRILAENPEWNVALAREHHHPEAAEFLHYTKGPLVVQALADLVRRRSGVTLEMFMKDAWSTHGFHASPLALREALEDYTGDSYDDFWAVFVDEPGLVWPSWPEIAEKTLDRRMKEAPAAQVGELAVHPEYLFWLAWSGRFERFADIVDFLEDAGHAQAVQRARGLELLNPPVASYRYAFPAVAQFAVDQASLDWPEVPRRAGCTSGDPARTALSWTDVPAARQFQRLLELEADYEASLGPQVGDLTVLGKASWFRKGQRLAVGPNERFVLHVAWTTPPVRARMVLRPDGGKNTSERGITLDPTWRRTRGTFEPQDRPENAHLLLVGAGRDGAEPVLRPLWQGQTSFTPKK